MNFKDVEVLVNNPGYQALCRSTKLSVSTKLDLTKFMLDLAKQAEPFEKTRDSLIEKFAKKDEEGNRIPTADGRGIEVDDAFEEEYEKLQDSVVYSEDPKFILKKKELADVSAADLFIMKRYVELK